MMRLPTISTSEGKLSFEALLVVSAIFPLLLLNFSQVLVESVVSVVPELSIRFQPFIELAKGLRSQVVDPLVGDRMNLNHPGLGQHAQVLAHLRLVEMQLA